MKLDNVSSLDELIEARKQIWEDGKDLELDKNFTTHAAYVIFSRTSLLEELLKNPEKLIPLMFLIVNKKKQTVPFFPNSVQDYILGRIKQGKKDFLAGKRNSLMFRCLKGRQQGCTAIITAYQLALTLLTKNFSGFTMADTGDNSRVILNDKAKYPYHNLPKILKPHEKFNSATEIFFDQLNSSWRTSSAESGEAGRSRTLSFFHGSECGFWKNYESIMAALNPALTADSIVFEESTANGHNDFYTNWFDKESEYENIFIPWWKSNEYRLNFESADLEENFKNSIEIAASAFYKKLKTLRDKENLDYNQLYWYFSKKKTLKDKLEQEYPCTDSEAFLYSGRPYFDRESVENNIIDTKNLVPLEVKMGGSIIIWERPIKGEKYYIGADIAEGLEEGDSSHAKIMKGSEALEVATIHGKFSTDRFGNLLVDYAQMYNNAYIAPENNNHGHAVLNTIYISRKYKNVHFEYDVNRATDKKARNKKLGWTTTESTKYIMLDELDSAIRNNEVHFRDVEFYKECHKVLVDAKGKVSINGKDRVAAAAIAWQMRKYYNKSNNVANYYALLAKKRQEELEEKEKRIKESGLKVIG